ncbi:LEA type 2 family protein [Pseudomonas sp. R5(2019)]|uniref:LEA type 2 family protein n=1 Tax=Pseudomonas sp. R5(2019) TaxID=2697566 RepID=UPI0014129C66|nr:LEA type 2 family protein [Pseudomonas sp. R5(2019)]NBA94597.1 hypothetical protein [Pseudomonas sp. R5(2019)]
MDATTRVLRLFALTFMLGLGGCATWFTGNFQDPDIHLLKVEVVKAKLLQQAFVLHFRIDNPNDSNLPIRGLRYRVLLNDILLADGEDNSWFFVPAHGRKRYSIDVRTSLWRNLKPLAKTLRQTEEPIHYRLEGELKSGLIFGRDLQLSRTGEIIPGDFIPE